MRAWTRLAALLLAGCAAAPPAHIPAQLPADLTGVVMTLLRTQPLIVMAAPAAFTRAERKAMEADLNLAAVALAQLSAGHELAVEIPLARTIDTLAAVVPFTPALTRWTPVIDAIDAVLPGARNRRVPPMTPDQGRQALGIRIIR